MQVSPSNLVNSLNMNRVSLHVFTELAKRLRFLKNLQHKVNKLSEEESFFRKTIRSSDALEDNKRRLAAACVLYHEIWTRFPEEISISMGAGYKAHFNDRDLTNLIQTAEEFVENSKALREEFDSWWKYSCQGKFWSFFSNGKKFKNVIDRMLEKIASDEAERILSVVGRPERLRERLHQIANQKLHPNTVNNWIFDVFSEAKHFFSEHPPAVKESFESANGTVAGAELLDTHAQIAYLNKIVDIMENYTPRNSGQRFNR
jgi:hypothetical protein